MSKAAASFEVAKRMREYLFLATVVHIYLGIHKTKLMCSGTYSTYITIIQIYVCRIETRYYLEV